MLIKQGFDECRQNVSKRIEFITDELKRCNNQIDEYEKKQDKHRDNIQKLQQKLLQQYQTNIAAANTE